MVADQEEVYHELYVGTKVGTFKRYISKLKQTTDIIDVKAINKGDEITHLSWKTPHENEILVGLRNGTIKIYNTNSQTIKDIKTLNLDNEDNLVGVGNIDNHILTALNSGIVNIWNGKDVTNINAGPSLEKMRMFETNICATGGKENPLKLWDLRTQKNIFTAKNIPHDKLQLRVPIWVSDMEFLSDSEVVTASRYDNICFYDIRVQRRPITRIQFDDATYSCVSRCFKDKLVAVGGGKGLLQVIDMRKPGKILHTYKGSIGAVKDVKCDKNLPFMFTVSLDRRLRIYDLDKPCLIEETYLVSSLNCLLVKQFKVKTEIDECEPKHEEPVQERIIENDADDLVYESKDIYEDENSYNKNLSNKHFKRKQVNKFVKNKKFKN